MATTMAIIDDSSILRLINLESKILDHNKEKKEPGLVSDFERKDVWDGTLI